jgi:hypothetical protein
MTGGRFELGVGLGYHETEFTAFGRQVRQRPSLLEDSIAVIRCAWSGSAERYEGKRFSSPGLPVTPVPETVPRLLIGTQSEPGIASQWVIVAEDPERAWAEVGERALYQMNEYGDREVRAGVGSYLTSAA